MLETLNLVKVVSPQSSNGKIEGLTPICTIRVDSLQHCFVFSDVMQVFFNDAKKKLLASHPYSTCTDNVVIRHDADKGYIAFTLAGADGTEKEEGLRLADRSIIAHREIAKLNLVADAQLSLFKASDYTLIGRILHHHLTIDPYKTFKEFLGEVADLVHRDRSKHLTLAQTFDNLLGRQVRRIGDSTMLDLTARRLLSDLRVSMALETPKVAKYPIDTLEIIDAALDLALKGYGEHDGPQSIQTYRRALVRKEDIEALITTLERVFNIEIARDGNNAAMTLENIIVEKMPELAVMQVEPEPEQKPEPEKAPEPKDVKEEARECFPTLEQFDTELETTLLAAGFGIDASKNDIELPLDADLLCHAINHANAGERPEHPIQEIACYYAGLCLSNKSEATRNEHFMTFSYLCRYLSYAMPNGTAKDCEAFINRAVEYLESKK
ncbi:hypothetical protein [Vibrio phage vB_ValS_PJ32]|nr:hypothetical protein [Vibrio phage vB_ValS_PJ32]